MTSQRLNLNRLKAWLTASAVGLAFFAQAQEAHWSEKLNDAEVNLYEVQAEFDAFWADKEIVRGQGYKQYKRWEAFWEPRLFPSGDMVAPDRVYREVQKNQASEVRLAQAGVWTYFGNTDIPSNAGGVGRVNMLRTDPNNINTYYACAPAGGLWRSTSAGTSWSLMNTDALGSIGVSDVAIDPNNPGTLYLATGDGDAGDTYALGVLKSTDDGATWNTTGLNWTVQQIRRCNRIVMDPTDSDVLLVATSNGVYRTSDAGANWTQTLSGNYKDVQFKSGDTNTVYTVGNSDDFFYSLDNGLTWTQSTSGLPTSGVSRMALTVATTATNTLYILAGSSANQGFEGYYRSQDSGLTWTQMSSSATINLLGWDVAGGDSGGQAWYDLTTACDPNDENTVYVGGVNTWKSSDGGATWNIVGHWYGASGTPYVHADVHGMYFIPGTSILLVACDGGVFRTINGGASFADRSSNLEIAQIYRLGVNQQDSEEVLTGWQDNGTNLGSSGVWSRPIGGDGFESIIDHTDPNIMYGTIYYGRIYKSFNGGGSFSTILNSGGTDEDENGAWLTPYVMSKTDHNTLFVAKDALHVSADAGGTWTSYTVPGGTANSLAVAESNENYIYVGKGGTLYRSTDGGTTFTTLSGLSGSSITYIAVDPVDETRVWVTFSGFGSGAKVYASDDAGDSWSNFSTGLPNIPCNTIAYQSGTSDGMYVGTDAGVYYRDASFGAWQPFNDGLPNVVVTELEIQEATSTLVAATYGRGVWRAPLFAIPADDGAVVSVDSPTATACSPDITPVITIGNFGSNTATSMTVEYGMNGVLTDSYNWTGSLATGETTQITLPGMTAPIGTNSFVAEVTVFNGVSGDDNATNDAKSGDYIIGAGEIETTVSVTTDCWGSEITWELRDALDVVLISAGPFGNLTTYNELVCLTDACYTFEIFDSFGDGLNGAAYAGCGIDGTYSVTQADGTLLATMAVADFDFSSAHPFCTVPTPTGCTDATACNYDATATVDDGSCIVPDGCTDNTACNYNAAALCDDGSCVLPDGCTDATACNYNAAALCNDGSCVLPDGCTDATACNYNAAALCDDGSCVLPDGCTDATACNYNAAALCDDGSCVLPDGCTDLAACNYDAAAMCDDSSCEYASCDCPKDLNNDGFIGVGDILILIGDYQCTGTCIGDIDNNGVTDTSDLLDLLAEFGSFCP